MTRASARDASGMPILRERSSASASARPRAGSTYTLWIFSGVCSATSSISIPPSAGGHHTDLLRDAVHHHAEIELLLDVGAFLDEEPPDLLTGRTGLVRDELHAENLRRPFTDFIQRLGHLDAATLAATTCVDLRFHDPDLAAEVASGSDGLVHREAGGSAGRCNAVFPQDFLRLILVEFHGSQMVGGTRDHRCRASMEAASITEGRYRNRAPDVEKWAFPRARGATRRPPKTSPTPGSRHRYGHRAL